MAWYARGSWRLARQVTADLLMGAWVVASWAAGRLVDGTIRALAEPARQTARVADQLRGEVADAATQAGGVPVVGEGLRQPFDGMAGELEALAAAANQQVAGLEQTALLLGWLAFCVPVALMLALWLPPRLRFAERSRSTLALAREGRGTDLLALRALATQPLAALDAVGADPVAGWRAGDPVVVARLAELELVRAGVRRSAADRPRRAGRGADR